MDDAEFDKLYAAKIRRAGAPDLSEEDWERLLPALEAMPRGRRPAMPLWRLIAVGGLILLSYNIAGRWMCRQSEKRGEAGRNEWQKICRERALPPDGTATKAVVNPYDTLLWTVVYPTAPESLSPSDGREQNQTPSELIVLPI
jgi:hypothetical protein